jgi:hypothetical protein
LTLPASTGDLTFWTAETGGTQLVPDANNVLETVAMPTSGDFDGKVWAQNDAPSSVNVDPSCTILAQVLPPSGPAVTATATVAATGVTVIYVDQNTIPANFNLSLVNRIRG